MNELRIAQARKKEKKRKKWKGRKGKKVEKRFHKVKRLWLHVSKQLNSFSTISYSVIATSLFIQSSSLSLSLSFFLDTVGVVVIFKTTGKVKKKGKCHFKIRKWKLSGKVLVILFIFLLLLALLTIFWYKFLITHNYEKTTTTMKKKKKTLKGIKS